MEAAARPCRSEDGAACEHDFVLIGLAVLIAILTVVAIFGLLPSLRIVPDDTNFDFIRFRRISFPISALLSIVAIVLFFTHGLNFGIDFKGGTLMEVQPKAGPADIAQMRATLTASASAKSSCSIRRPDRRADPRRASSRAATRRSRRPCRRCAARSATPSNIAASRWSARACPANCWPTA